MTKRPFHVHLGTELWEESLVAGLTRLGHTVSVLETAPDNVYISRYAWRIPKGINQSGLVTHIETVMKQVRLLANADQTEDKPEGADPQPGGAPKRKRAAAKVITTEGSTGGSGDAAGSTTTKVRKKRGSKEEEDEPIAGC
jgi:hypothetical protein